jgi:hypothetical protein
VRDAISYFCVVCYPYAPVHSPATLMSQAILFDYRYAFFKNGEACYCGVTYGRYRPAECLKLCNSTESASCEERVSNVVLDTGWMGMLHKSPSSC